MSRHIHVGRIWITSCKVCAKSISQHGSGRPRNNCGNHKKIKKALLTDNEKKHKKDMYRLMSSKKTQEDRAFVNQEKLRVGRCAMHPFIFDGAELLFNERTVLAGCWDHVDRSKKVANISALVGRARVNRQVLLDEMAKCILLCANCHQIKTYEENDYRQIDRVIAKLNQPSLFDIDPT